MNQRCPNCGATLGPQDLTQQQCTRCKTALPGPFVTEDKLSTLPGAQTPAYRRTRSGAFDLDDEQTYAETTPGGPDFMPPSRMLPAIDYDDDDDERKIQTSVVSPVTQRPVVQVVLGAVLAVVIGMLLFFGIRMAARMLRSGLEPAAREQLAVGHHLQRQWERLPDTIAPTARSRRSSVPS